MAQAFAFGGNPQAKPASHLSLHPPQPPIRPRSVRALSALRQIGKLGFDMLVSPHLADHSFCPADFHSLPTFSPTFQTMP